MDLVWIGKITRQENGFRMGMLTHKIYNYAAMEIEMSYGVGLELVWPRYGFGNSLEEWICYVEYVLIFGMNM